MLVGGIAGGVGAGFGSAASQVERAALQSTARATTQNAARVATSVGVGVLSGGVSAAAITMIENIRKKGEINERDLENFYIQGLGATPSQAATIIEELKNRNYYKDGKVGPAFKGLIILSSEFRTYAAPTAELFANATKIMKENVRDSALIGAVVGGIASAATSAN